MVRFVFIVSFVNSLIQGLKEFSGLHKQRNYQVQLVKTCPNVKSFTVKHFWVANIFGWQTFLFLCLVTVFCTFGQILKTCLTCACVLSLLVCSIYGYGVVSRHSGQFSSPQFFALVFHSATPQWSGHLPTGNTDIPYTVIFIYSTDCVIRSSNTFLLSISLDCLDYSLTYDVVVYTFSQTFGNYGI